MARAIHCANCSTQISLAQVVNGDGLCKLCDGAQTVQSIVEQAGMYDADSMGERRADGLRLTRDYAVGLYE